MATALEWYKSFMRRQLNAQNLMKNPDAMALLIHNAMLKGEGQNLIREIITKRFATGGASGGSSWPQLAVNTQKQRARQGYPPSAPMLFRSGLLAEGAVYGKIKATPDGFTMTFKDGPAPMYLGGKKHGFQKVVNTARAARNKAMKAGLSTHGMPSSGRLSDYADALNNVRSFYGPATPGELGPLLALRDRFIGEVMMRIANGQSLSVLHNLH